MQIQSRLAPFLDLKVYKNNLMILKNNIESLNKDFLRGKQKKLQRDILAFASNRAYRWNLNINKNERDNPTKTHNPNRNKEHREDPSLTLDEGNQTIHLPLPSNSFPREAAQDVTQFSTYTTEDETTELISVPKRLKIAPEEALPKVDKKRSSFSFSQSLETQSTSSYIPAILETSQAHVSLSDIQFNASPQQQDIPLGERPKNIRFLRRYGFFRVSNLTQTATGQTKSNDSINGQICHKKIT